MGERKKAEMASRFRVESGKEKVLSVVGMSTEQIWWEGGSGAWCRIC